MAGPGNAHGRDGAKAHGRRGQGRSGRGSVPGPQVVLHPPGGHGFPHTIGPRLLLAVLTGGGVCVEGLELSSHRHGQVLVVAVRGELDVVTSREFDEYLTTARRQSDRIILDLAAVDFMDTSSLAVIVGHWKKLTARHGILALAGARYRYTKTLWITGLADRLPRYDTLEQAVAAVADGSAGGAGNGSAGGESGGSANGGGNDGSGGGNGT